MKLATVAFFTLFVTVCSAGIIRTDATISGKSLTTIQCGYVLIQL